MQRRIFMVLALAGVTVATPLVQAWNSFGGQEPDTASDRTHVWMWPTSDTSSDQNVRHVYFNAFLASYPGTTINPNAAAAGSGFTSYDYAMWAALGVWKDCNNDGYMGLGEQGILEYRAEILTLTPSICPVQTTPLGSDGLPTPGWFPSHNDGQWVRELLSIQWRDALRQNDENGYNVDDNAARVWIDVDGHGSGCWINPQPTGTYRSTGGAIKWLDCFDAYAATDGFDSVADSDPRLQPFSFSDDPRDQYHSSSQANVQNPWGTESDASDAQAWDCSKTPLVQRSIADPTSDETLPVGKLFSDPQVYRGTIDINVSAPAIPPGVSTSGSAAGTMNATASGLDECHRSTTNNGVAAGQATVPGNGVSRHPGQAAAHAPYTAEGDVINDIGKVQTYNMRPISEDRTNNTLSALGRGTPANLGVSTLGYLNVQQGTSGFATACVPTTTVCPPSFNGPAAGGDGLWFTVPNIVGQPPPERVTAYAFVSPTALGKALGLPGDAATWKYGGDQCGGFTSGVHDGWDCASADWYLDANRKDVSPRDSRLGSDPSSTLPCTRTNSGGCKSYGARVGATYVLRDDDCYDDSVPTARGAGVSFQQLYDDAANAVDSQRPGTVDPYPDCFA